MAGDFDAQEKRWRESVDESLGCLAWIALGVLLTLMTMCARMR